MSTSNTGTCVCELCGEPFSIKRKELGYNICLECGEELAQQSTRKMYEIINDFDERVTLHINKKRIH